MDPPQGTFLGDAWRFVPRGWRVLGIAALLGLAAWGVSGVVQRSRRATLRAEVMAFLATLPPVPRRPVVPAEDDAAPVYLDAGGAVRLGTLRQEVYGVSWTKWTTPPPGVVKALDDNAEALRLLEEAAEMPAFGSGPTSPFGTYFPARNTWDLVALAEARALVEFREGRIDDAVHSALLVPRMAWQMGAGGDGPWRSPSSVGLAGPLQLLEEAVADPRLGEGAAAAILRHLPTGAAAKAASVADFERDSVRNLGSRLVDFLAEDGEAKARAMGWGPPTAAQRVMAFLGKSPTLPTSEPFPTVGGCRELWEASMAHKGRIGVRGPEAVAWAASVPYEPSSGIYIRDTAGQYAHALRSQFVIEARLEVVRAAAALRLEEMRKGIPPAALPGGTLDPFTLGPLHLETHPDGWEVSSAGPGRAWPSYFPWKDLKPVIRWRRPTPLLEDGGK